jgi:UDP-N-acetylglucosamine 1-carboxyvinyltransferase
VNFYHPGGDIIGKRSIDTHLEGFKKLGFVSEQHDRLYKVYRGEGKAQSEMFLEEATVTGTENIILAAVIGSHEITLKNCAKEPHVVDLCNLLNKMGAKIQGVGEGTLTITGVEKLHGTEFRVGQDFMEMATYAIAAAITGGSVSLQNCTLEDMEPVTFPLMKMGLQFREENNNIHVTSGELKAIPKLHTNIWPGFPTDLMSVVIVLATQSHGVSLLHDWMYESRMFFVDKLINMGANITIADPHRVLVSGPSQLYGRVLESPDIRAGMAMLLAALVSEGESKIKKAELIDRGYEEVVEKLSSLGANIKRED